MGQQFYVNKNIKFLVDKTIEEWDIERAGLSALLELGLISRETYDYWKSRNKQHVSVYIGANMGKTMVDQNTAITKAVDTFLQTNNVTAGKLISRKKDAIFLFDTNIKCRRIGYYNFRPKTRYTSYYKFDELEIYYSSKNGKVDIKGIDERFYRKHKLIPYLKQIMMKFELLSRSYINYRELYSSLYELRKNYINLKLPVGCYREMSYGNYYRTRDGASLDTYGSEYIEVENFKRDLLINYNFTRFIVPFINILTNFAPSSREKEKYKREWKKGRW